MHIEYTKALLDLIHEGTPIDTALHGVHQAMQKRGHARLYGKVLRSTLRVLSARNAFAGAFVSVACEQDIAVYKAAITDALKTLEAEKDYEVIVDDTLIGGYVINAKNHIIDASYKSALVNLYHRITH